MDLYARAREIGPARMRRMIEAQVNSHLGIGSGLPDGEPIWPRLRSLEYVHFITPEPATGSMDDGEGQYIRRHVIYGAQKRVLEEDTPLCSSVGGEIKCASWVVHTENCDSCLHKHSSNNMTCRATVKIGRPLRQGSFYLWGSGRLVPGQYERGIEETRGKSPITIITYKRVR